MHEMHVIRDLFEDLVRLAKENDVKKIKKVYLRMGEYTEINEEILRHFFTSNGVGTCIEGAELEIETSATRELTLISFDAE